MPNPIPFTRRLPPHLAPPPRSAPENDAQIRARQLALTRELADLNMLAARDAAQRIVERDPHADPAETTAGQDPTLALARATRAVTSIIAIENRILAGERARTPSADDPRAAGMRRLLHPLTMAEPDPIRRRALRCRVDDAIEDALYTDLDDNIPIGHMAWAVAQQFGLELDLARVHDDDLGIVWVREPPPNGNPRPEANNHDQR